MSTGENKRKCGGWEVKVESNRTSYRVCSIVKYTLTKSYIKISNYKVFVFFYGINVVFNFLLNKYRVDR